MTREAFIRKWLANPQKQYNEQCRDEMRDDLDLVIKAALGIGAVSGRSEHFYCVSSNALVYGKPCEKWCGDENCKSLCEQ